MSGWRSDLVEVRPSRIHGLGVFALTDIPAGTRWWSIDLDEAISISRRQFALLAQSASAPVSDAFMAALQTYSIYLRALDVMVLIPDNGRFVNHCDVPNSAAGIDGALLHSVALRDIAHGEEITEDYATYDDCDWPGVGAEFHEVPGSAELAVTAP